MTMRIQPDTIRSEVEQVVAILAKWQERLAQGIPGDEIPSNDLNSEIFQFQLRGEIQLAAERLMALVEVLEV
jgi:hypothetical protein